MLDYSLEIVGVYVGLNLLINLYLAFRVSQNRVRTNLMTGTGDDDGLYNANRAHVTNVEYTPIGLIGLIALHLLAAPVLILHVVGLALTLGRLLHAWALSRNAAQSTPPRLTGILLTWASQLVAALACLWYALT
ncbi:MAG: MAPEG family protein [Parvibaculaceae bacterium]|nr:MAPEG family protein [Parvibaculaceae bacterium]